MKTFLDVLFEHELLEATIVRRKINKKLRRISHIKYLKNKARLKLKAKKFRRSSKFKQMVKKAKKMKKMGKTSTGRRLSTFI
jgi:hypothetical protein